jgi:hypothetical protein
MTIMPAKTAATVKARRLTKLDTVATSIGRRGQRLSLLGFFTLAVMIQCRRLVRTLPSSRVLLLSYFESPPMAITSASSALPSTATFTTLRNTTTTDHFHDGSNTISILQQSPYFDDTVMNNTIGNDGVEKTEEEFQWEYLNLAHNVSCGQEKCYFRRIHNDDHKPYWKQSQSAHYHRNDSRSTNISSKMAALFNNSSSIIINRFDM